MKLRHFLFPIAGALLLPFTFPTPDATGAPVAPPTPSSGGSPAIQAIGFSNVWSASPELLQSTAAWGDYDADGDLDLALAGRSGETYFTLVFRNDGGAGFTDIGAGLPGVIFGSLAWADLDNDGDLDLALTGKNAVGVDIAAVYRYDGGNVFTDLGLGLPGVETGCIAWGDYDHDGRQDFLLMGSGPGGAVTRLYHNDGGGAFSEFDAGLPATSGGTAAWGDYDNDGDLDLLLCGSSGAGRVTRIYRSVMGSGVFEEALAGLPGLNRSTAQWGDFDADGDLDILLTGNSDTGFMTRVYRNDAGTFTNLGASFLAVGWSMAAWGDVDNDGDLDIAVSGDNGSADVARIYRYDGGSTFTDISAGLTGVEQGCVAWADYDNDGDLDLLLTGNTYSGPHTGLWRSTGAAANTAPAPPGGLTARVASGGLRFEWTPGSDAQTPAAGLSYNVRVGTTPGGSEIVTSMAIPATGFRQVTGGGDAQERLWLQVNADMEPVYWSVQTVDGAGAGSAFAAEQLFIPVALTNILAPVTGVANSSVHWGDYDNDGDLDVLLTGNTGWVTRATKIFRNGGGTLFEDAGVALPALANSGVDFGDYDNDGDLDIALMGMADYNVRHAHIYRNDGGGVFTDIGAGLLPAHRGVARWADFDNDGDLDLLLAGDSGASPPLTGIYRNDGGDSFTLETLGLTGLQQCSAGWGDYDADGDLDLIMTGWALPGGRTIVYRNDGGGVLTSLGESFPGLYDGGCAWGDYDSDGDLDFVISGNTQPGIPPQYLTRIYRNDGSDVFTALPVSLPGLTSSSVLWGDWDNDGDLDLLLTGYDDQDQVTTRLYRNQGGGEFVDAVEELPNLYAGAASWADFDQDGRIDLLMTGVEAWPNAQTRIYRNSGPLPNTPPTTPTNLLVDMIGNDAVFHWTASTDVETPAAALTYNLRVGTTPGGHEIVSPMSDPASGRRMVPDPGNVQHNTSWTIHLPAPVSLYWTVQSVDACGLASEFAPEMGLVPALISLARTDAAPDFVHITWYAAQTLGASARVYRRTAETPWMTVGRTDRDGSGYLRFEDTTVEAGVRYGYRLGVLEDGEETYLGETWIEVPDAVRTLTLEGARPNPGEDGELHVQFDLPLSRPAHLELLDVSGRRIARHDEGTAGRHFVSFGRDRPLAPGVYVLRLTQGDQVRTGRAAVIQ